MPRHVPDEVFLLPLLSAQYPPQHLRLHEILVRDGQLLRDDGAGPLFVFLGWFDGLVGHVSVRGGVVWVGAVIAVDGHDAIALIGVEGAQRLVDGNLLIVDAKAVAVGVWVAEEAGLQDWVGRGLDAGNHVRGAKGDLLDYGKVVFGVFVEDEFTERAEGHFALGPDFGQVKDVPAKFFGLGGGEDLDVAGPGGAGAVLDGVEKVLGMPVGVFSGHLAGFVVGEGLAALIGLAVDLDVVESAVGLGEFVGVTRVAVHVAVGVGGPAVGEEVHDLVGRLLVGREVVPEHGGLRFHLLRSQ